MDIKETMQTLVDELNMLTKAYDEGHPLVSDKEWDDKYFELVKIEEESGIYLPDSPTQKIDFQVVNKLEKVAHNHPMLSLAKTKSIDDLKKFIGTESICMMHKMDGLTCSLRYVDGRLVSAETRGNGEIGENILHSAKVMKSIPKAISNREELIIDGEVICDYNTFELFKNEYSNPRNMASGTLRLLDAKESAKYNLTFVAWDIIKGFEEQELLSQKLESLKAYGFTVVNYATNANEDFDIESSIESLKSSAAELGYPIDGVVVKYDNIKIYQSKGKTAHHFSGGIAFKFYDEEYETTLRDIEWQVGRTSILSPVAVFDEVDLDGALTNKASLSNLDIIETYLGKPYKGQPIKVARMNMVIPKVVWGDKTEADNVEYIMHPLLCPVCHHTTEVRTSESGSHNLYCSNPMCSGVLLNKLDYFCGKFGLDIKGISESTLTMLISWGWVSKYEDIFYLRDHRAEWVRKAGFSITSVDKILTAIDEAKNCELWRFISAIGIPTVGPNVAKEIAKREETWSKFELDIQNGFDFSIWDGFGPEMNTAILKYAYEDINNLVHNILNIQNTLYITDSDVAKPLSGLSICITGSLEEFSNREELSDKITALGGKIASGVSKKTSLLINNDSESTSSKNNKAKELGIPILTEKEFIEKYLVE